MPAISNGGLNATFGVGKLGWGYRLFELTRHSMDAVVLPALLVFAVLQGAFDSGSGEVWHYTLPLGAILAFLVIACYSAWTGGDRAVPVFKNPFLIILLLGALAGSYLLSWRHLIAMSGFIVTLWLGWLGMRWADRKQVSVFWQLAGQWMVLAGVCGLVWALGGDQYSLNHPYINLMTAALIPLLFSLLVAGVWARFVLFREICGENASYRATLTEFPSPPAQETARMSRLRAVVTSFWERPFQVLLFPAIVGILVSAEWLKTAVLLTGFVMLTLQWAVGGNTRWRYVAEAVMRPLSRGASALIAILIIVFMILRWREVSYVTTVYEGVGMGVVAGALLGAYTLSWIYRYWVYRLATERLMKMFSQQDGCIQHSFAFGNMQVQGASHFLVGSADGHDARLVDTARLLRQLELYRSNQNGQASRGAKPESGQPGPPKAETGVGSAELSLPAQTTSLAVKTAEKKAEGEKKAEDAKTAKQAEATRIPPSGMIRSHLFWYHFACAATFAVVLWAAWESTLHKVETPELVATSYPRPTANAPDPNPPVSLTSLLASPAYCGDDARPAILLAASGGGTRAALYTAAVFEGIARMGRVHDIIFGSGVSGGGAALAYFAGMRDGLAPEDGTYDQNAWDLYFEKMSEPFIEDVLAKSSEWRMVSHGRLGILLAESFRDRWGLPKENDNGYPLDSVRGMGLIFNTSLAGKFEVPPGVAGELEQLEVTYRGLTTSAVAGGRLLLTNLDIDSSLAGDRVEPDYQTVSFDQDGVTVIVPVSYGPLPVVVRAPETSLEVAAALNANFPPVFSNAAVDLDNKVRYWVTDGGTIDNRGMEMLLFTLRRALQDPRLVEACGGRLPRIQVVVADASSTSHGYSQNRGFSTLSGAGAHFAGALASELKGSVAAIYQGKDQAEDFQFEYIYMPDRLRSSDAFGTHWMMQPRIRVQNQVAVATGWFGKLSDTEERTVTDEEMIALLRALHTAGPPPEMSANACKVLDWALADRGHSEGWRGVAESLGGAPAESCAALPE